MQKRYWLIGGLTSLFAIAALIFFVLRGLQTQQQDVRSQAKSDASLEAETIRRSSPQADLIPEPTIFASPKETLAHQSITTSKAVTFTLSGTLFIDTDGDALWDFDETGYSGATITLIGGGTRNSITGSKGEFNFSGLSVGSYSVTLIIPSGYMVTTNSLTNLYLSTNRRHHIGIKQVASTSSSSSSATPTPTPTPTVTPTPSPTPNPFQAHYYVSTSGSDSNTGTSSTPYLTIQKAVTVSKTDSYPGVVVHVSPGTYRESVNMTSAGGTATASAQVKAENGQDTVYVVGSQSSQSLTWAQNDGGLTFPSGVASHIYRADVTAWGATPELAYNNTATPTRLPKAREPDWGVTTAWKYHENWWKADGIVGSTLNSLVDTNNDTGYPEATANAGNISSINGITSDFLAGARIFAKDTYSGHDSFTTTIASHTASSGTLTFDTDVAYYDDSAGIGQYAKYFVEGKPQLLDQEGEWYYDSTTHYLYIWPPGGVDPSTLDLEFAVRNTAFSIRNSSYVTLTDLNLQYTNYTYSGVTGQDGAIRFNGFSTDTTSHVLLDGLTVAYNGVGIRYYQSNADHSSPGMLSYVTLQNSTVKEADSYGVIVWPYPRDPGYEAVINHLWFENNEFSGFAYRGAGDGMLMQHPRAVVFINNYFHNMSHNTLQIQQGKTTAEADIYVANNFFDAGCYNGSDCGALKILHSDSGSGTNTIFVSNNIFRGTMGWSYAYEAQSSHNSQFGYGYYGFGYYSDVVYNSDPLLGCSVILYRNISQGNSSGGVHFTRGRDQCAFYNVLAQNGVGIGMNNYSPTTDGSFGNILRGNIIQYNESGNSTNANIYGVQARINQSDEDELEVNRNIYQMVGTHAFDMFKQDISYTNVGTFSTVANIQSNTPWEDNGSDTSGKTIGLTTEDHYDISSIESTFGVSSVTFPTEATTTINALNSEYSLSIANSTNVGLIP